MNTCQILILLIICVLLSGCEHRRQQQSPGPRLSDVTVINNSSEMIWIESIKSKTGEDFRCGFLKPGAKGSVNSYQPVVVPTELAVQWWVGDDRSRPEAEELVLSCEIELPPSDDLPKGLQSLVLTLDQDSKWSFSLRKANGE